MELIKKPRHLNPKQVAIMKRIDELFLDYKMERSKFVQVLGVAINKYKFKQERLKEK